MRTARTLFLPACLILWVAPDVSPASPPEFVNKGILAGFTGANQKSKVTESGGQDQDGNGSSLQCTMLRDEPDVPNGGCHAEAHLSRFPTGEPVGTHPGFRGTTTYQVRFDAACDAASVGFFQYKNFKGPRQWNHLVAIWRLPGRNGCGILFQTNPSGENRYFHARLSEAEGTALVAGRWHEVRVKGHFTSDETGWVEVAINGHAVEWHQDAEFKNLIGKRISGNALPDLPGSEWQLQLGGYGFFKDRDTKRATVHVDAIRVAGM